MSAAGTLAFATLFLLLGSLLGYAAWQMLDLYAESVLLEVGTAPLRPLVS